MSGHRYGVSTGRKAENSSLPYRPSIPLSNAPPHFCISFFVSRSLFRDSMTPSTIDWCDSCEAYFLPVCNQAAQIKLAEIISVGE